MVNELEFVIAGIVLFLFGLLLIISPVIDNLVTAFTGYKDENLQKLAIICLFAGGGIAITGVVTTKKSRK